MRTLLIALLIPAAAAAQEGKRKVIVTLPVLKSITDELAGDWVEATALAKPEQDPHAVSPTPSLMKRLREAELFIEIGLQLEIWADEVANGSGNPRVARGAAGRITASAGIPREDVPQNLSRAEGDLHPEGNTHLWLDPLRAKAMAENIATGLKRLDPARAAAVDERLRKFRERIDEALFGAVLIREAGARALTRKALDGTLMTWLAEWKLTEKLGGWMKRAAPLRGRKAVEYHRSWIYPARLFGFEIVGSIQPKPGIDPTPSHLEALKEQMRVQKVGLIVVDEFYGPAYPRALADATGARVAVVPAQPGGEDYVRFIDRILDALLEAAK